MDASRKTSARLALIPDFQYFRNWTAAQPDSCFWGASYGPSSRLAQIDAFHDFETRRLLPEIPPSELPLTIHLPDSLRSKPLERHLPDLLQMMILMISGLGWLLGCVPTCGGPLERHLPDLLRLLNFDDLGTGWPLRQHSYLRAPLATSLTDSLRSGILEDLGLRAASGVPVAKQTRSDR